MPWAEGPKSKGTASLPVPEARRLNSGVNGATLPLRSLGKNASLPLPGFRWPPVIPGLPGLRLDHFSLCLCHHRHHPCVSLYSNWPLLMRTPPLYRLRQYDLILTGLQSAKTRFPNKVTVRGLGLEYTFLGDTVQPQIGHVAAHTNKSSSLSAHTCGLSTEQGPPATSAWGCAHLPGWLQSGRMRVSCLLLGREFCFIIYSPDQINQTVSRVRQGDQIRGGSPAD